MQANIEVKRHFQGLTGFHIKCIAVALMVLDHIQYFFSFTGVIPLAFSWLGRLAGGLFLFLLVEGFTHTRSRKKYFLRLYLIGAAMGLVQFGMTILGLARPDGFIPMNGVFMTFALTLVMMQGIAWLEEMRWLRGLTALLVPFAWPYGVRALVGMAPGLAPVTLLVHYTLLPMHPAVEGGTGFVLSGLVLYIFRKNRKVQAAAFALFHLAWYTVRLMLLVPGLPMTAAFWCFEAYEWMGAGAALIMLLYNGQRGRGIKNFFYIFYPAHVYILYILSCGVYYVLMR